MRRYFASSTLSFSIGEWHTVRVSGLFGGSLLGCEEVTRASLSPSV